MSDGYAHQVGIGGLKHGSHTEWWGRSFTCDKRIHPIHNESLTTEGGRSEMLSVWKHQHIVIIPETQD